MRPKHSAAPPSRALRTPGARAAIALLAAGTLAAGAAAWAHGDVTPQAVDTTGLPRLGEAWRDENPFR